VTNLGEGFVLDAGPATRQVGESGPSLLRHGNPEMGSTEETPRPWPQRKWPRRPSRGPEHLAIIRVLRRQDLVDAWRSDNDPGFINTPALVFFFFFFSSFVDLDMTMGAREAPSSVLAVLVCLVAKRTGRPGALRKRDLISLAP
jgi:hypothetical protein